jgi:hypothetical protein
MLPAAVLAADAAFAHVLAERTAVVPRVAPTSRASGAQATRAFIGEECRPGGSR